MQHKREYNVLYIDKILNPFLASDEGMVFVLGLKLNFKLFQRLCPKNRKQVDISNNFQTTWKFLSFFFSTIETVW